MQGHGNPQAQEFPCTLSSSSRALSVCIDSQTTHTDRAREAATGEVDLDVEAKVGKVDWRAGRRFSQARSSLLALKDGDLDFKYQPETKG